MSKRRRSKTTSRNRYQVRVEGEPLREFRGKGEALGYARSRYREGHLPHVWDTTDPGMTNLLAYLRPPPSQRPSHGRSTDEAV